MRNRRWLDFPLLRCERDQSLARGCRSFAQLRRHSRSCQAAERAHVKRESDPCQPSPTALWYWHVQLFRHCLGQRRADVLAQLDLCR